MARQRRAGGAQLDLLAAICAPGATLPPPPAEAPAPPSSRPVELGVAEGEAVELELGAEHAHGVEGEAPAPAAPRCRMRTEDVLDLPELERMRAELRRLTNTGHFDPSAQAHTSTNKQGEAAVQALNDRVTQLPAGWARPMALDMDCAIWGRWSWWLACGMFGRIIEGDIPQIEIADTTRAEGAGRVIAHLWRCVDKIVYGNRRAGLHYMIDWIAWALGVGGVESCPSPAYVHPLSAALLYEMLPIELLQLWPADYFGEMLCEFAHGQGKGETAFFPTPMGLTTLMAAMTHGVAYEQADAAGREEMKRQSAYDPAVGTGRTLLAASNHCLRLYAQDIDPLVLRVTHINLFLYAPWGAAPMPHLFDESMSEPLALTFMRLGGIVEMSLMLGQREQEEASAPGESAPPAP